MLRTTTQFKKAERIYNHFGFDNQIKKLEEEFAECFLELVRFKNGAKNIDSLLEELADYCSIEEQVRIHCQGIEVVEASKIRHKHTNTLIEFNVYRLFQETIALNLLSISELVDYKQDRTIERYKIA